MPSKTFSVDFETSGFRKASRRMNKMGKESSQAGSKLKTAGKVGAAAIAGIATAVTGAVAGLGTLMSRTTEYAKNVDKAAAQSGVAAERIQEIAFAAQQTSGADFEDVRDGLKELAIRSEEAAMGTGEAKEAFDRLGISQQFLKQSSTEEVFSRVRKELQGASKRMRIFAAETIFGGEAGQRLVETLGLSADEMANLSQEAQKSGKVLSGSQVKALESVRSSWNSLTSSVVGFGRQIAARLAPMITGTIIPALRSMARMVRDSVRSFTTMSTEGGGAFSTVVSVVKGAAGVIMSIWNGLVSGLSAIWDEWGGFITDMARSVFQGLQTLFFTVAGIIQGVWDTLVGVLTGNWNRAWEGIKNIFTSVAITIIDGVASLVESVLDTLSKLSEWVPGFGDTLKSGFDFASGAVEDFRDSLQGAAEDTTELDEAWANFSSGGGSLLPSLGGGPSQPDTSAATSGGGEGQGEASGKNMAQLAADIGLFNTNLTRANSELDKTKQKGSQVGQIVGRGFERMSSAVGSAVTGLIAGKNAAKSFGETMVSALKNVLSQLVALIPKLAIIKGIGAIAGISTGGITSIGGVLTEAIPFLDTGGRILSDGIAKVHKGETVVPKGGMAGPQEVTLDVGIERLRLRLNQNASLHAR